jgi:septum formation protein
MPTRPPLLILASGSPRRQRLLSALQVSFVVAPSGVDEAVAPALEPAVVVRQLARAKAAAVAAARRDGLVIGCDTVVVRDGRLIGKPRDAAAARATLRYLRGVPHQVLTGLTVIDPATDHAYHSAVTTTVVMTDYDDAMIARYVATGEPMDKAGSYAAQGEGARLIAAIDGCYTNVVGLPLCELARLLRLAGLPVTAEPVCTLPDGRPCPRLDGAAARRPSGIPPAVRASEPIGDGHAMR